MSDSRFQPGCARAIDAAAGAIDCEEPSATRARPGSGASRRRRPSLGGMTLLVVEDHDDSRAMFVEYLALHGALALEASSVAEAIEILEHRVVDVVITDVAMPVEDGYALIARMRADARWRDVPVVVASGNSPVREAADRAPGAIFLAKPLVLDDLVLAVRRAERRTA